jgi:hypothetical protein
MWERAQQISERDRTRALIEQSSIHAFDEPLVHDRGVARKHGINVVTRSDTDDLLAQRLAIRRRLIAQRPCALRIPAIVNSDPTRWWTVRGAGGWRVGFYVRRTIAWSMQRSSR